MMSLTGLLVTVRSTVTYARARYSPHRLRHSAIAFILGASLRGVQDYDGCNDPCATARHQSGPRNVAAESAAWHRSPGQEDAAVRNACRPYRSLCLAI